MVTYRMAFTRMVPAILELALYKFRLESPYPRVDVLSLIECFPIGKAKASTVAMKSVTHFLHVFVKN